MLKIDHNKRSEYLERSRKSNHETAPSHQCKPTGVRCRGRSINRWNNFNAISYNNNNNNNYC